MLHLFLKKKEERPRRLGRFPVKVFLLDLNQSFTQSDCNFVRGPEFAVLL